MTPTQIARQTTLNEYLNAAIAAFLAGHPDTELPTVKRALGDALTDAEHTFAEAMK